MKLATIPTKTDNKFILVTTEQERQDAGVFLDEFYCLNNAKSKNHVDAYDKKINDYSQIIRGEDKNWIEIRILNRRSYRYEVSADCRHGFKGNKEARFTPKASANTKDFLQGINHKTNCCFSASNGNCLIYASFTTWDDAVEFATFLCNLDSSNYLVWE